MSHLRSILYFALFSLLFSGCQFESAKSRNASIVESQTQSSVPPGNINNNSAEQEDEEVPKFNDAVEALRKGDEYLDANKTKNAIDAFKQSAELDPDLAEAHFKLGVAYSLIEDELGLEPVSSTSDKKKKRKNSETSFENAVKAYKKLIRENPKDHTAYFNLGRAYNKLYDDEQTERALKKAVDLNPDDSLYRTEYGVVLIKLAKYSAAVSQLRKAIELDSDNIRAEDLLTKARAGQKRTNYKSKTPKRTDPSAKNRKSEPARAPSATAVPTTPKNS